MMNKNLKAEIVRKFGNQFLFSIFAEVHETEVSRVIRGRRSLSPENRVKWAQLLGLDPKDQIFEVQE